METEIVPQIIENKVKLAEALGLSVTRVKQLIKKGMPVESNGTFNLDKVQAWRGLRKGGNYENKVLSEHKGFLQCQQQTTVGQFKLARADVFAQEQLENLVIQKKIRDHHFTDEQIKEMTSSQAKEVYRALGTDSAIKYDKERLERGESTENVSVIVQAIREAKQWQKRHS